MRNEKVDSTNCKVYDSGQLIYLSLHFPCLFRDNDSI